EEEGDALRKTYLELPSNLVDADNCASRRYEYNFDSDGTNEILTHPKCFTNEVWLISEEGPQIDSDIIESDVELNDIDYFYSFLGIYTGGDGTLKIYSLEERSDAKVIVEYILNESLDEITTGNIYASNDLFSTLHRTSMDIDGDNSPEFVAITSTDELAGNILSINQDSNELYVFGTHNVPLDSTYRKATDENGVLLFEFHNSYLSYEY
ncbi:hypothetical protein KKA47_05340, partial [bacterium]|nr:hypothetical protein [bacterium]